MKKVLLLCSVFLMVLLTGCATVGTPAGVSVIYSDVTAGHSVTSNTIGTKVGYSAATNILGLVATGDASIQTAARAAGITKVSHIDQQVTNILGVYAKYTTIVYGE